MFAFAIMAAPVDDLRAWVTDALTPYGYALGAAGEVDGPAAYAARPWHVARSRCPFVGPLAGYVTIEPVWETFADHPELKLGILREGRGVIARLDDDRALAAVALRRFDVGWLATGTVSTLTTFAFLQRLYRWTASVDDSTATRAICSTSSRGS